MRGQAATNINHAGWWLWRINSLALLLWPLGQVFCLLVRIRRSLYQRGYLASAKLPRPVIVVGNLSVGGSGKTPVVVSLVQLLAGQGYRIGILSRGYKSDFERQSQILSGGEQTPRAGDEANMLSQLCRVPVAIGADRVAAGRALIEQHPDIDLLIADDGLQHYALQRDLEFIVHRRRALGNRWCLPAGPLREPLSRMHRCDLVIDRDGTDVEENLGECWNLADPAAARPLSSFRGQKTFALAGIGFPELFFDQLRAQGLDVVANAFPDHYEFTASDLAPFSDHPLLVTHKDAVKLQDFSGENIWVVPLELALSDELKYRVIQLVEAKLDG